MDFPSKLGTGEMNDVWRVPDSCGQRFKKSDFSLGARMRVNRKIREQNVAQMWPNFSRRGGKLTSIITLLGSLSCLTSCRETGIRGDQSAGRNQFEINIVMAGTTGVSSENSDPLHSRNSEPSGDSRKG